MADYQTTYWIAITFKHFHSSEIRFFLWEIEGVGTYTGQHRCIIGDIGVL